MNWEIVFFFLQNEIEKNPFFFSQGLHTVEGKISCNIWQLYSNYKLKGGNGTRALCTDGKNLKMDQIRQGETSDMSQHEMILLTTAFGIDLIKIALTSICVQLKRILAFLKLLINEERNGPKGLKSHYRMNSRKLEMHISSLCERMDQ